MTENEKTILWLRLTRTAGIGPVLIRRLYEHFGSVEGIFGASEKGFHAVEGIRHVVAKDLNSPEHLEFAKAELERCAREGVEIITFDSPAYPKNLAAIPDPPPVLYVKGRLEKEDERSIAMVGSRNHNEYAEVMAKRLGSGLARFGLTVVSGLARGIDSLSQQAALDAGGRSIAVLGTGVDVIYPPESKKLYFQLIERGAVLSEFPLGTHPARENFPHRNRLIAGLALGVVLVQANNPQSGALITVKLALEQGRTVYAVPGNAGTQWSRETNRLLKKGAVLVEDAEDIVADLFPQLLDRPGELGPLFSSTGKKVEFDDQKEKLYSLIPEPEEGFIELDQLIRKSGMDAGKVQSLLIELELFGVIEKLAGGKWRKKKLQT
jgi:DNA processing protein